MEGQSSTVDSHYQYQSAQWSRLVRRNTVADAATPPSIAVSTTHPTQLDLHTSVLLSQQPSFHQLQLAQYNRLFSTAKISRLQTPPLPPLLSAQHIQAEPGTRSSSSGVTTTKVLKGTSRVGHGNNESRKSSKGERVLIAEKETSANMPGKNMGKPSQHLPSRSFPQHQNSSMSQQSNSVPSTPHQHARKFSFESREPSPNATHNHSPRSAYSESNITLPSTRPAPPRGGCIYETALAYTKRRMPYSIGGEKLEKVNNDKLKSKLSRDEERKLTTDMRELYDRLRPTPAGEMRRIKLVDKLEKMFNDKWPGHNTKVHVFGSSGNLLCTDQSDVDICITTDMKEMEGVCIIADLLAKNGMQKVICVSTAKVPIVKIWDPELELACDMNVNNTLALENTRMIKTYVEIDPRVRPLALIIKHWTKRRIVNDAAFGGTLSSYTWICMIINFLQSRAPPILPALHQRPHLKLPSKEGVESAFADDLDALRAIMKNNKETLGDLLLAFFRFYAHDFDYEECVVSVRSGKQISKKEKGWHITNNNRLCVEEPFNTGRNLANTADDTSFRGLHMELRRAFDLISEGKLDECCEKFIFPKEEGRVWERPKAKPVVIRSTSTASRGGRGGSHRNNGGRHNGPSNRNGNGNRRASSGAFDHNPNFMQNGPRSASAAQDAWLNQQAQAQLHNDLFATYSVLQAQENSLRMQLYAQGLQVQAYAQSQAQSQGGSSGGSIKHQTALRHRGSSFDQGPMTAPIRPEAYYYPINYQATPNMYGFQTPSTNPSTNPSSPSLGSAQPELRRSMHRSTMTNGSGQGGPQPNSSMRSHSQPAARPVPSNMTSLYAAQHAAAASSGLGIYQSYRQVNGIPIPNFIADDNMDPLYDSAASVVTAPEDNTAKEYVGYYVNSDPISPIRCQQTVPTMAIPAFGDIGGQTRRRLSTDQLPQSILDRLKRPSRSPSPLGHDRSFSTGTHSAPLTSLPQQYSISSSNLRDLSTRAPLVVNGSSPTPLSIPHWQAAVNGSHVPDGSNDDVLVGSIESLSQMSMTESDASVDVSGQATPREARAEPRLDHPIVVNESNPLNTDNAPTPVPNGIIPNPLNVNNGLTPTEQQNGSFRLSPNIRQRIARQSQNGGMSPLDIGMSQNENLRDDLHNLSPVYETRTPSPTANRKFESPLSKMNGVVGKSFEGSMNTPKPAPKPSSVAGNHNKQMPAPPKANGHTRAAKSEGAAGTWVQIPKGKKKGGAANKSSGSTQVHSEKPPVNESERKGG